MNAKLIRMMVFTAAFVLLLGQMVRGQQNNNPFPHNPDAYTSTVGPANYQGEQGVTNNDMSNKLPISGGAIGPSGYSSPGNPAITGPTGKFQGVIGVTDYINPPTLNGPKKVQGLPGDMGWP